MKQTTIEKPFATEEEYFAFEEASELRHELINNNLFEMSGVSIFHNDIVLDLLILLRNLLKVKAHRVAFESYKVRTPNGNFFYPDIMVCEAEPKRYFAEEPVLIVEVLSEPTRKFNLVDKFIQYQKLDNLQYYLCIEPEMHLVLFYFKATNGEWLTETYQELSSSIHLKALGITFTLQDIYQPA